MTNVHSASPFTRNAKKIGILGGTFDPIHLTHLHMAEVALEACQLDEVWFMPAHVPPHKQGRSITEGKHRVEMVRLAIEAIPYFQLLLIEFERQSPSYTIDTMRMLRQQYQEHQFHFIIGGDMVSSLGRWKDIEELVNLTSFIGVGRPEWIPTLAEWLKPHVTMVEMIPSFLSSTLIRERKKSKQSIRFLVPEEVYSYIEENQLYE